MSNDKESKSSNRKARKAKSVIGEGPVLKPNLNTGTKSCSDLDDVASEKEDVIKVTRLVPDEIVQFTGMRMSGLSKFLRRLSSQVGFRHDCLNLIACALKVRLRNLLKLSLELSRIRNHRFMSNEWGLSELPMVGFAVLSAEQGCQKDRTAFHTNVNDPNIAEFVHKFTSNRKTGRLPLRLDIKDLPDDFDDVLPDETRVFGITAHDVIKVLEDDRATSLKKLQTSKATVSHT
jgi:hypothetical protein